jgi:hypothetical protein
MIEIKPVTVERFDMGDSFYGQPEMQSSETGDYVEFAAYEALQKENAALKATISNLTKAYERESNDCLKALEERDYWYEKTDSLADKISEVFDVPIGEHSNINCPIVEAMKILCGEYVTKFDKENEAQAKCIAELEEQYWNQLVKVAVSKNGDSK